MKKILVAAAALVLVAAGVWAQQGPGGGGMGMRGHHRYDPSQAVTISGDVVQVKEFESPGGMHKAVGLTLNSGGKNTTVHLGPQFYLDKQAVKIAAGDAVEITGVKMMRGDQEILVAGQVKKGDQVLKLHDEATGRPMWAGEGPGGGPGVKPKPKAAVGC